MRTIGGVQDRILPVPPAPWGRFKPIGASTLALRDEMAIQLLDWQKDHIRAVK